MAAHNRSFVFQWFPLLGLNEPPRFRIFKIHQHLPMIQLTEVCLFLCSWTPARTIIYRPFKRASCICWMFSIVIEYLTFTALFIYSGSTILKNLISWYPKLFPMVYFLCLNGQFQSKVNCIWIVSFRLQFSLFLD